ncbi:hypothetical protein [Streptomyces venezuelae]
MQGTEDQAIQILSNEGAQCGQCGDQPGDRVCPDCEACRRRYVAALMAAGWAPRTQPADRAERRDRYAAAMAKRDGYPWPPEFEDDERDYRRRADAAITVADAELAELRTENARMRHELEVMYGGAFDKATPSAPADRDLRDRLDAAIGDVFDRWRDGLGDQRPEGAIRDAVLAVLPTPADRAAVLDRVREWVTSDVVTATNEFGNGYREAQRDIRDLLAEAA